MTFVATAEAVVHAGATPVIADVDPKTLLLRSQDVAAVRTAATRAVIPVHLYGHVVPFDTIRGWREQGLVVVEDAAQAHLGSCTGRLIGDVGHAACFSFYPGKNLGALGDAGMVLSSDVAVINRVRKLRDHGRATKYTHDEVGLCSRMDGLQAALLNAKLGHLREWTDARRELADRYHNRLGSLLVPWEDGAVHHLLVARVSPERREAIIDLLNRDGIGTGVHYPVALSGQPALARWSRPCPAAESGASEVLSLPMDPLMTEAEVDTVCSVLESATKRA